MHNLKKLVFFAFMTLYFQNLRFHLETHTDAYTFMSMVCMVFCFYYSIMSEREIDK